MKRTPNTAIDQLLRMVMIILLILPLLIGTAEEAHAQRRKKGSTGRPTPQRVDRHRSSRGAAARKNPSPSRAVTVRSAPDVPGQAMPLEPPYADLASEVIRDVASPVGTVRRVLYMPPETLTPPQLALVARYKREESRILPRPYAAVADNMPAPAPIYAEANVGLYSTADVRAGISGRSWPFDYVVRVGALTTAGSVDNADRSRIEFGANGGYVINDNAWIFSGGHMGGELAYSSSSYSLFAAPAHPERTVEAWNVGMSGENTYLNDEFALHANYRALAVDDADSRSFGEHALEGTMTIGTPWMGLILGGEGALSLATFNGGAVPYSRLAATITLRRPVFSLQGGLAASMGENRDGSSSSRVVPTGRISIAPSPFFSISGELTGGIQQWRGDQVLEANPWVLAVRDADMRHEDQTLGYRGELRIGSAESFTLHVSASHAPFASYLGYTGATDGRFVPVFQATTVDQIGGETMVRFDPNNMTTGSVRFSESTIDATGDPLPYSPRWVAGLTHSARLAPMPLTLIAGVSYIGDRVDGAGGGMDPVTLLTLEGRYRISSIFELTASLTNLLDERYELWRGYQERGIFASLGIALRY